MGSAKTDKSDIIRKVPVPDHIWDCYEIMADEMGNSVDGLVSQALFVFARLNGYLSPASIIVNKPNDDVEIIEVSQKKKVVKDVSPPLISDSLVKEVEGTKKRKKKEESKKEQKPITQKVEKVKKVEETPEDHLFVATEDGGMYQIINDKFIMGRGSTCDIVINSKKISREHAVILKKDDGYYIEDYGSSNGTWFEKERVSSKKINHGDEYNIFNFKIKCTIGQGS